MLKRTETEPTLIRLRKRQLMACIVFAGSVFWLGATWSMDPISLQAASLNAVAACVAAVLSIMIFFKDYGQSIKRLSQENLSLRALHQCEMDSHKHALSGLSAVCVLDGKNRIVEANEEFTSLVATTRSLALMPLEAALPDIKGTDFWAAIEDKAFWSGEIKLDLESDGKRLYLVTAFPQISADGVFLRTLLVMSDRTAEKVGVAEDMLHAALEHMSEDVYVYDVDTLQIRYMNQNARRRCNWSEDIVRTKHIMNTTHEFDLGVFRKYTAPIVSGEKEASTIQLMGGDTPFEIVTSLVETLDGKKLFVSTVRELSDRKAIENARIQSVSMISHELRTPLTSIKGALSLLASGTLGEVPPKADPVLKIAVRNSDRLLNVINDILDYEKLASGNMSFSDTRVDFRKLVAEAVDSMKGYAELSDVTLVPHFADGEAIVFGDADRLMQVLLNLISNAAKFSPSKSEVMISLTRAEDRWRFAVRDNGPGIPESMVSQLGEPFVQFEATRDKKHLGTGLGLTIVKKILAHHDSVLLVSTQEGEGSEFAFEISDDSDGLGRKGDNLVHFTAGAEGKRYGT